MAEESENLRRDVEDLLPYLLTIRPQTNDEPDPLSYLTTGLSQVVLDPKNAQAVVVADGHIRVIALVEQYMHQIELLPANQEARMDRLGECLNPLEMLHNLVFRLIVSRSDQSPLEGESKKLSVDLVAALPTMALISATFKELLSENGGFARWSAPSTISRGHEDDHDDDDDDDDDDDPGPKADLQPLLAYYFLSNASLYVLSSTTEAALKSEVAERKGDTAATIKAASLLCAHSSWLIAQSKNLVAAGRAVDELRLSAVKEMKAVAKVFPSVATK